MDLMIFRSHHINNNNNDEKRTLNALIKRTRIWTHRWIYERFVSYEPLLCFTCVIFVQNEAPIWWEKIDFFFLKKGREIFMRFLSWGNSFGQSRLLEEKKMKATPLILGGLESSSLPRLLAVFAEENSWSRSLKKAQKNECVVVSSFV